MEASLYCGADGCTLHDYSVAPTFCEFAFQNNRVLRVREDEERRFNRLVERLIPVIAKSLGDAVFDAVESNYTGERPYVANRGGETPSISPKKSIQGGISI